MSMGIKHHNPGVRFMLRRTFLCNRIGGVSKNTEKHAHLQKLDPRRADMKQAIGRLIG
jgi:hypothetical protein